MSRRLGLRLAFAIVLTCGQGAAEPTFWDVVREPTTAHVQQMWLGAERALAAVEEEYWTREIHKRTNEDCAEKIQLWGGAESENADLMFLFGQCLVGAERGYDALGRDVLLRAIELYPTSPRLAVAWATVGIAAKRTSDPALELWSYGRALESAWDPAHRAELYLRRGHAHMRASDLPSAIADLQIAWRESATPVGRALAQWALAVALDRSHDLPAALPHARDAAAARMGPAGTLTALEVDGVDLDPPYEVHYYRALPYLADAEGQSDVANLVGSLEAAQALFLAYAKAAASNDRWVPRAREHVDNLRRRLSELLAHEQESGP